MNPFSLPMKKTADYKPLLLVRPEWTDLQSEEYVEFLLESAIRPGLRLFLQRHAKNAAWPYLDTKFNPNTGDDLPAQSYDVIYPWLLGRGMEALTTHLRGLPGMGLPVAEYDQTEEFVRQRIDEMVGGLVAIDERHEGSCPFLVDRMFRSVETGGSVTRPSRAFNDAGNIFAGKAFLLHNSSAVNERGTRMLDAVAKGLEEALVNTEKTSGSSEDLGQGMYMLFLGAASHAKPGGVHRVLMAHCERFLAFVLDHHYDEESATFSESINPLTYVRGDILDPGHCAEFVGLGLSAIEAIETRGGTMTDQQKMLFERARMQLPRLLVQTFRLGFNARWQGIFKTVNHTTGAPINSAMPWWNLPETMRAALRSFLVTQEDSIRAACMDIFVQCRNAYFQHYLNRRLMLFPYQTRCGKTGSVLDVAPLIPEGDPLYHSNLCILDVLNLLRRPKEPKQLQEKTL